MAAPQHCAAMCRLPVLPAARVGCADCGQSSAPARSFAFRPRPLALPACTITSHCDKHCPGRKCAAATSAAGHASGTAGRGGAGRGGACASGGLLSLEQESARQIGILLSRTAVWKALFARQVAGHPHPHLPIRASELKTKPGGRRAMSKTQQRNVRIACACVVATAMKARGSCCGKSPGSAGRPAAIASAFLANRIARFASFFAFRSRSLCSFSSCGEWPNRTGCNVEHSRQTAAVGLSCERWATGGALVLRAAALPLLLPAAASPAPPPRASAASLPL